MVLEASTEVSLIFHAAAEGGGSMRTQIPAVNVQYSAQSPILPASIVIPFEILQVLLFVQTASSALLILGLVVSVI